MEKPARRRLVALAKHISGSGAGAEVDGESNHASNERASNGSILNASATSDVFFTNSSSKKDIALPTSLTSKVSNDRNPDMPAPPAPLPKDHPEVRANPWYNEIKMLEFRRYLGRNKLAPEKDPGVKRQILQKKMLVRDRLDGGFPAISRGLASSDASSCSI